MKHEIFYKCRWCEKIFDTSITTGKTAEELTLHAARNYLLASHQCDDIRHGIADLIGVKEGT